MMLSEPSMIQLRLSKWSRAIECSALVSQRVHGRNWRSDAMVLQPELPQSSASHGASTFNDPGSARFRWTLSVPLSPSAQA